MASQKQQHSSSFLRLLAQSPKQPSRRGNSPSSSFSFRTMRRYNNNNNLQEPSSSQTNQHRSAPNTPTTTGRRRAAVRIQRRRRRRLVLIVGVAILLVLGLLLVVRVQHRLLFGSVRMKADHGSAADAARSTVRVQSPFDSHPPNPIPLDTRQRRHACLAQIRLRHAEALAPYVRAADSVLLVDPAYHSNVGDHMITVAELQFLRAQQLQQSPPHAETTTTSVVQQCSYAQAGEYVPPCDKVIVESSSNQHQRHKLALWHGGGNWGDLWRRAQEPRLASLVVLLQNDYTVVTLPNSWYYRDVAVERSDIQQMRHNVAVGLQLGTMDNGEDDPSDAALLTAGSASRVVLTWRERYSYDRARQHLPFVTHRLVPDIAFQLGPYNGAASRLVDGDGDGEDAAAMTSATTDLLVLLRDDHESLYAPQRNRQSFRDLLDAVPGASRLTFSIVDWKDRLDRFHSRDIFFTDTAIRLLASGRVVICDRLHAAILAYLAGLPFIYVDQISGKITKTLAVAMESGGSACSQESAQWAAATNLTDAIRQAVDFLERYQLKASTTDRQQQRRDERQKRRNQQQANPS